MTNTLNVIPWQGDPTRQVAGYNALGKYGGTFDVPASKNVRCAVPV